MNNRWSCNPDLHQRRIEKRNYRALSVFSMLALIVGVLAIPLPLAAGDAPGWMHAVVNAPLPAYDEKTNAVLLYSDKVVTVLSADKVKTLNRSAYKILRPGGREMGSVVIAFPAQSKISNLRAWSIPANGKDYEVKEKDGAEVSLPGISGSELISDVRAKVLRIPAADPGNIIGYEYEREDHPFVAQDIWYFQDLSPVREAHYSLQLPPGWEYKASWLNHPEVQPVSAGNNLWRWSITDVKGIRPEDHMPARGAVAGHVILSFFPVSGSAQNRALASWREMGSWYGDLTRGRRDSTPEIKQKAMELTASAANPLDKMRALASFVQRDIRYVAIELGIGGWQPHQALDVFSHRYGDCKDKATLMSSMLHEIGVESYYVAINTERGGITPLIPPNMGSFNHVILAIRLPEGAVDPPLVAMGEAPKLGRILFFDPTSELTPFGQLPGSLQANYGLLVTQDGGELMKLPVVSAELNGIQRTAKLTLDSNGTLQGAVTEIRVGDRAAAQRDALRSVARNIDKIKPIETVLAHSLATFRLTSASVTNLQQTDRPFQFDYSLVSENYAKAAGNLLLVRPRVLGSKSSDLLDQKDPRKYPVAFDAPSRDSDVFEIVLPTGYEVDDLPPPVSVDAGFASYHSKTEVDGHVLRYTRTFEVKDLLVPLDKLDQLRNLYHTIAGDERNTAVLKAAAVK